MKKTRFSAILVSVLLIATLLFALTSCFGGGEEKHIWEKGNYETNETHHWQVCQKKGCDEIKGKAEHTFVEKDILDENEAVVGTETVCSVCGYKQVDEDPVDPETPVDPEVPTDPETPTEPTDPETPVDPETPTEGETPTEPETPETPEEPAA